MKESKIVYKDGNLKV